LAFGTGIGIESQLLQVADALALALAFGSRKFFVTVVAVHWSAVFSVSVIAKNLSPEEIDSSRPRLCTEQATVVATFGRHCRLVLSFQKEK
jgi:hypothetical protein